jgi:hypothetical protein
MSGVNPVLWDGPDTMPVNVAVTGGQLVMPDSTTGKVKPATASATTVLGVALADAAPTSSQSATNFSTARPEVAVAYGDVDVRVTYAANCAWGVKLMAAANGQVTPYVAGTADMIVGICTEPAGATSGSAGRMRLCV